MSDGPRVLILGAGGHLGVELQRSVAGQAAARWVCAQGILVVRAQIREPSSLFQAGDLTVVQACACSRSSISPTYDISVEDGRPVPLDYPCANRRPLWGLHETSTRKPTRAQILEKAVCPGGERWYSSAMPSETSGDCMQAPAFTSTLPYCRHQYGSGPRSG